MPLRISWLVANLNTYKTNRVGKKLFPFATISASVGGQLLGNYTGVYEVAVTIDYSDTAAKISQEDFDNTYCQIFEAFYEETPPLFTKIQSNIFDTKVYTARITSQTPTIQNGQKGLAEGLED
jgi:hypothetical protein